MRNQEDTESVIDGRPDLEGQWGFGITEAKTFPPYVFSINGNACLVHKVQRVELHWWTPVDGGRRLGRLRRPRLIAHTCCSQFMFLNGSKARTCRVPDADALLCGRCHGEAATFGKNGKGTKGRISRQAAHVKLGCVVKGY